jgi:hypothetical protein
LSYYTDVELVWLEDEPANLEGLKSELEKMIAAEQYSEDLLGDLLQLLVDGEAAMNLHAADVTMFTARIARLFPQHSFSVRGRGEAVRDIWLRDYEDGEEVFALGPPADAV